MIRYHKTIEQALGSVTASIVRTSDGYVVEQETFIKFLGSSAALERRFIKAHAWADARLEVMHKHTVTEAP